MLTMIIAVKGCSVVNRSTLGTVCFTIQRDGVAVVNDFIVQRDGVAIANGFSISGRNTID